MARRKGTDSTTSQTTEETPSNSTELDGQEMDTIGEMTFPADETDEQAPTELAETPDTELAHEALPVAVEGEAEQVAEEPAETAEQKAARIAAAIEPFLVVVQAAVDSRDLITGTLSEVSKSAVTAAYREVDGTGPKAAARTAVNDKMVAAIDEAMANMGVDDSAQAAGMSLARAYKECGDALVPAKAASGASTPRERKPAEPVNLTKSYVSKLASLYAAAESLHGSLPEGLDADFDAQLAAETDRLRQAIAAALAFYGLPVEEQADDAKPEGLSDADAVLKLTVVKQARTSTPRAGGGSAVRTYTGAPRSTGDHILQALASVPVGTFQSVAQIRAFKSDIYGDDQPSAGAISARLFPKGGKCTLLNVEGVEVDGKKGARLTA